MTDPQEMKPCARCGSTERVSAGAGRDRCAPCRNRWRRESRAAARRGDSPEHDLTHGVPEGFHLRGASTLYGADGSVKLQWVKSNIDPDNKIAGLIEAVEALKDRLPIAAPIELRPSKDRASDLLSLYPMGDPHLGMYSWAEESGVDFDLEIAERQICAAADQLVTLAPESKQALIVNLGDFFHADNKQGTTTRGTPVDVDDRWSKVLQVGVRVMCRLIDRALEKHEHVRVINAIGNHDDHTSVVLGICLAHHYQNNPRVEIDTSPAAFHYYRFGGCLVGVTHGHRAKGPALESIMAHDRADDWAETQGRRYWYVGHIHHSTLQEYRNCVVESFRTLAARDAWHAAMGYRSGRDMRLDVLHKDHGQINRHIVGISRLEGEARTT